MTFLSLGIGRWPEPIVALAVMVGATVASGSAVAAEPSLASPWVAEQTARTRLVAGGTIDQSGKRRLYAGVEIALEDGWKTYWRNPGSSGVPPTIDWKSSENVASAEVLFPAPVRFRDRDGDTIGYKHAVVLPVRVMPKDPAKPVVLHINAEFGICREVCIPVQPKMTLDLPPDAATLDPGANLVDALRHVPSADAKPGDPRIQKVAVDLKSTKPHIVIEAAFPGDAAKADIFLEAPDGIWIPMPKPAGAGAAGARRFEVDLSDGADLGDLKGRMIRMTLVGDKGQSESTFKFE